MKRRKAKQNQWEDHYTRRARKENQPARSVYKLEEIQQKFRLLRKGQRVLDLGCAPGSWLLYAAKQVGDSGRVTGIDLQRVTIGLPSNARVLKTDILTVDNAAPPEWAAGPYDIVMSDMAPATSGNKFVDAVRSAELCRAALDIARTGLVTGGGFICKIFQGEDFKPFLDAVKQDFRIQKNFKPQSCRKASKEIYIIGMDKKQEETCQVIANGRP